MRQFIDKLLLGCPGNLHWRTRSAAAAVPVAAMLVLSLNAVTVLAEDGTDACSRISFTGTRYIVCKFDPSTVRVEVVWRDGQGRPFGSLGAVRRAIKSSGREFLFAMNGGMYDDKLAPVGYYVEQRQRLKTANTRRGFGNFHMLPNGIFYIDRGRAGVMETRAFLKRNRRPDFATQSGPMLVINGALHPRFNPKSKSRKSRNGVGVSKDGRNLFFAISERPVTFYEFARLFQAHLKTPNALFLDGGSVPQIQSPKLSRLSLAPVGPVVAVTARPPRRSGQTSRQLSVPPVPGKSRVRR